MDTLFELIDVLKFDLFGPTKASIFYLPNTQSLLVKSAVAALLLLLSIPFHLLAPFWILFLVVFPYACSWVLYLIYAQKGRSSTLIPLFPLSPLRVYKVNKAFFKSLIRLYSSPVRRIIFNELWNGGNCRLQGRSQTSNQLFLVLSNLDFGSNAKSKLDIYYKGNPHEPLQVSNEYLKPVILFFYGGGWSGGRKDTYRALAENLVNLGYLVVIPDYVKFPKSLDGTAIVNDVTKAIDWTLKSIRQFGGDSSNVTIVGHGAGAHLVSVSLISTAVLASNYEEMNSNRIQPDVSFSWHFALRSNDSVGFRSIQRRISLLATRRHLSFLN